MFVGWVFFSYTTIHKSQIYPRLFHWQIRKLRQLLKRSSQFLSLLTQRKGWFRNCSCSIADTHLITLTRLPPQMWLIPGFLPTRQGIGQSWWKHCSLSLGLALLSQECCPWVRT